MKNRSAPSDPSELGGYELLICVCGGIAAYKVCEVVSSLVKRGAGVTVAMTRSARRFVGPLTFQALTGRKVLTSLWHQQTAFDVEHIALTGAADQVLVAPATASMLGKIAGGIADEIVSTLVISAASPVVLVPAMNDRMWTSAAVAQNVKILKQRNFHIIEPVEGWLACRSIGQGRMAEPHQILETILPSLTAKPSKQGESTT